jgi:uncharacterized RDD family membrane protein YckC
MNPPENYQYAGFWTRALATAIDSVVLTCITLPLVLSIYGLAYFDSTSLVRGPADFLISWVMPMVAVIVLWKFTSATPGKMLVAAKIVDARTGGPLGTGQCIGRCFAYAVSILPLGLGFVWIAFDPRKQAWHDKLCGTVVVRKSGKGDWSNLPERPEGCLAQIGPVPFSAGDSWAAPGPCETAEQVETAAPLPGVTFGGQVAESYPTAATKL